MLDTGTKRRIDTARDIRPGFDLAGVADRPESGSIRTLPEALKYVNRAAFIFLIALFLDACGAEEALDEGPPLTRPEIRAGAVRRLSQTEAGGYRTVREGEPGPGILLTFPPVEYAEIPEGAVRLAGRVEPEVGVLINGEPVTVYPTGSFAALVPLAPGENTVTVAARDPGGETAYPLKITRKKDQSPAAAKLTPFKHPRSGRVIKPNAALYLIPEGARLFTLLEGAVLQATGREGNHLRVDLGGGLTGRVLRDEVELGQNAPEEPFRVGDVEFDLARSRARFALQTAVPARVEYLSPDKCDLIFYNAVADTRTINLGDWEGSCTWTQDVDGQAVFHLRGGLDFYRWSLEWENGGYSFRWAGPPGKGKKTTVCLDPGHGGENRGAVSSGGIAEKEANLRLARRVAERLRQKGITVVLTREDDRTVGLDERVGSAREKQADLFLSLHFNSVDLDRDPLDSTGCTVFFYHPPARELAGDIYRSLKKTGLAGRGVRRQSLAVIRPADLVAALVEVAYLSNPDDEARVMDPAFREKAARAIADGVLEYLEK
ncbi:MAG: N-acetylmuramoyl-L-alanine amidase [PVC group bacterium]